MRRQAKESNLEGPADPWYCRAKSLIRAPSRDSNIIGSNGRDMGGCLLVGIPQLGPSQQGVGREVSHELYVGRVHPLPGSKH